MASNSGPRALELGIKAGMEGLDRAKINKIIQEASVGSFYYNHQQERQRHIDEKIKTMKIAAEKLSPSEIHASAEKMDKLAAQLESQRDLSRIIVHVDMDAFYAAVEMRNNPELKDKPMAVGGQNMLGTSNYIARRYGVRAAMPGFIAMKLCPQLIIVPPHFDEYQRVSKQVQKVFKAYDPDFNSPTWDEGYLDITNYAQSCKTEYDDDEVELAAKIVQEMREKIFEMTQLTASAGIAPNKMLAKICSDMNKPNGQFQIPPCREQIMEFIRTLPVRKVNGIGGVTEQLLNSQGVTTCQDLWEKRGLLPLLFTSISSNWFLRVSLGIGSVNVKRYLRLGGDNFSECEKYVLISSEDYMRRSMSVERTFNATNKAPVLRQLCHDMCEELSKDLQAEKLVGRTVTLKMKFWNFKIKTKASTLNFATSDFKQIESVAQNLLTNQINSDNKGLKLRLMGVRISSLTNESEIKPQNTLDSLFEKQNLVKQNVHPSVDSKLTANLINPDVGVHSGSSSVTDIEYKQEEKVNDGCETTSAAVEGIFCVKPSRDEDVKVVSTETSSNEGSSSTNLKENNFVTSCQCPVCLDTLTCSLHDFNRHVDLCLNKDTIKNILSRESQVGIRKRKRGENSGTIDKFVLRTKKR